MSTTYVSVEGVLNSRKHADSALKHTFWNLSILKLQHFERFGKDGGTTKTEDPFNKFLEILNMRSISIQKHEMEIL